MGVLNQTPTLIHQLVGFLNLTRVWRGSLDGKTRLAGPGQAGQAGRMVSDWGRVYLMMRGGMSGAAGCRGVGRRREGGPLGPHKGRLGASGGACAWMDRGGAGGRLGALRALPERCMQCPSCRHKKTAKRGLGGWEGRD